MLNRRPGAVIADRAGGDEPVPDEQHQQRAERRGAGDVGSVGGGGRNLDQIVAGADEGQIAAHRDRADRVAGRERAADARGADGTVAAQRRTGPLQDFGYQDALVGDRAAIAIVKSTEVMIALPPTRLRATRGK